MSTFTWKPISSELAAAKSRRILDIISRAEQRIKLQSVSAEELAELQLRRKAQRTLRREELMSDY